MKHIKDFINEGLIGDIIMELLRRSLNWVDKGIDLVSDSIKSSVNSVWDIVKDKSKMPNTSLAEESSKMSQKDFTNKYYNKIFNKKTFSERTSAIDEFIESFYGMPLDKIDQKSKDNAIRMYVQLAYQNYLMTTNSNKVSEQEKTKARIAFEKIMKDPQYKKYIDEIQKNNSK